MIRFDEDSEIKDPYLKSLQKIFKKETIKQEKIDAFEEQGIEIDDQLESGVSDMCNYGSYVAASSEKKGIEKGLKEGVNGTISILRGMNIPDSEIAKKIKDEYKLTDEEVDEYLCVMA